MKFMRLSGFKIAILASILGWLSCFAFAQTGTDTTLTPPEFSVESLERFKTALEGDKSLSEEQISAVNDYYDSAITALNEAVIQLENAARFQRELESSPTTEKALRSEIQSLLTRPERDAPNPSDDMTGETLLRLEQELITRESEMRTLKAEITRHEDDLQALLLTPVRDTLSEAQIRLAEITSQLAGFEEGDLGQVERARRTSLQARQYYRRAQILALERESAGLTARQQIVTLRRDLAALRMQNVEQTVVYLQRQTGQRRLADAIAIQNETESALSLVEKSHPFVRYFATENINISRELTEIARETSRYPRLQAEARQKREETNYDLTTAQSLTKLSAVNRQSSAMLRRLRNQKPNLSQVKSNLSNTQKVLLDATQKRLLAQEALRGLPLGDINYTSLLDDWIANNTTEAPLSESDKTIISSLYLKRRELLIEVGEASVSQLTEAEALRNIQTEIINNTENLSTILDQKLLWLPSIEAVNLQWPQKMLRGTAQLFGPDHLGRILTEGAVRFKRFWLITVIFIALVFLLYRMKSTLLKDIKLRSRKVGRVQSDSYWHTPATILNSALLAAPIPLLVLFIGIIFSARPNTDPLINSTAQTFLELSGYLWFFIMWRIWNRDNSLFDSHFGLPKSFRRGVLRNLGWFIPFGAVSIGFVTLTQNSRQPDIYEGFSLLVFVITAVALSVFSYRLLWVKRRALETAISEDHILWRYRHILTVLTVGLPLMAAILAAAGYYDTARELLSRLFFSGGLVIATYVAYGLIRRTVYVAQRRLALKQAVDRREKMIRAREQAEAAEERGEPTPPPVDYEEIDLESISRQSSELLNTLIIIGFTLLMWVFWRDLLPALSIFDNVKLWPHEVRGLEGVGTVTEWISLWNVIQALVILGLTVIASKNLPGFLEVFVLNRSRMDAGTRYAVVSIIGYIIVALGLFLAFNRLGIEWSKLQWIVAALGVGIGFGLQEIIANFISGLIILFERPVRVGDYVTIGDQSGAISRIKIRATTLTALDNKEIVIPNKALITEKVVNWTLSNSITRLVVPFGVAYGTDTDKVRELIMDVVERHEKLLSSPKPQVFFLGFGDSSLDFEARVFLRGVEDRLPVSHELHTEINKTLDAAGISIPFPQRDLHIISGAP